MPNIFQQLLQDLVGTKKGQADEAAIQPVLTALTPLGQDLLAVATKNDPGVGKIVNTGIAVINAINGTNSSPAPAPSGPTEADVVDIVNSALTSLGLPSTDDAQFDAAIQTAYTAWQQANPT